MAPCVRVPRRLAAVLVGMFIVTVVYVPSTSPVEAFTARCVPHPSLVVGVGCRSTSTTTTTRHRRCPSTTLSVVRYGPNDSPSGGDDLLNAEAVEAEAVKLFQLMKGEFKDLLDDVLAAGESKAEELPSILARNVETVLTSMSVSGLIEEALAEYVDDQCESNGNDDGRDEAVRQASSAVNVLISFAEEFVGQTKSVDDSYKGLLGRIFKSIVPGGNDSTVAGNMKDDEDLLSGAPSVSTFAEGMGAGPEASLDALLSQEKGAFTAGFLRHVEGECDRISSQPTLGPEAARMLQILRVIQARVLEELGKEIGEGAVVLGQLLGYDDRAERIAVLEAGLTVRGPKFAEELLELTAEALEGFKNVGSVDPELVDRVREIDERIRSF